ncbi:MAG: ABC transporter substrate-binding protein [Oscillospiraceae bacterium]|nr:ABC transporter substrate-binding protein [Oscillospiraceae bacterium]
MKKPILAISLFALALLLCSCRVRTTLVEPSAPEIPETPEISAQASGVDTSANDALSPEPERADEPSRAPDEPQEPAAASDAPTERDEDAERREYDALANGELVRDAEAPLYAPTEKPVESAVPAAGEGAPVNVEADGAERRATETVPSEEADRLGADESGELADSVRTYYLTLLESRLGSLFECKRLYVYWETSENYRTIHRSSREHRLILDAGAYDVSAKLLEENLTVDSGWVARKNPDVIVKIAEGGALDPSAARALCDELAARPEWADISAVREKRVIVLSGSLLDTQAGQVAAMIYLAKLAYPAQMDDVDADEALRALTAEAFGSAYSGAYAYSM